MKQYRKYIIFAIIFSIIIGISLGMLLPIIFNSIENIPWVITFIVSGVLTALAILGKFIFDFAYKNFLFVETFEV